MKDQKNLRPPKLAIRFFRWYCRADRAEELEGDLEEFFYLRLDNGAKAWKASLFFWWNVFRCFRSYSKASRQNNSTMIPLVKSYLKLAARHSWKNKWSVLINVVGLGLALSMCIFVYSMYAYNIEFDSLYEDADDIYRINSMTFSGDEERRNELSPLPFEAKLRNDVSGVEQVSSFFYDEVTVKKGSDYFNQSVGVVSSDFFEMFELPLWYGSYAGFGSSPVVYLSKPLAKTFFGNEAALGEKLSIYLSNEQKVEVTVAGVFERIPLNSSFHVSMVMNLDDFVRATESEPNNWKKLRYTSHYVRTKPEHVKQITASLNRDIPLQNEGHESFKMSRFELVPFLSPIHNDDDMSRTNANTRVTVTVHIVFTVLVSMIFLIACFNLANTSMALIAKRLKEIGIRKTLGSENRQILFQFLLEMGIICFFAFIIGLSVIDFTSSSIMGLFGETFLIRDVDLTRVVLFIAAFLLFTTLVAGLMPAFYAWKFQPVAIMRKSVRLRGVSWLSKTLTVAQYSFSIAVLAAGITFSQNSDFLDELSPGYNNNGVYVLDLGSSEHYAPMKRLIDQVPGVKTVGTRNHLSSYSRSSVRRVLEIDTSTFEIRTYSLGDGYLALMEVPITSGRSFIDGSEADVKNSTIVNQEFVKQFFKDEDPINKVVTIGGKRRTIVGVFGDIIHDVYEDAKAVPTAFFLEGEKELPLLIAKVQYGGKQEVEDQFKTIWNEVIDRPYNGGWQKDLAYGTAVRDTENLKIIFFAMAILGGFLSIVGIFSLAKLNVAKKLKEISIRKVLGSTMRELLVTINRPFFLVLGISLIAGCILGFLISDLTLALIYRYYVDVSVSTTFLSGAFIIVISIFIITFSIFAPAKSNPIVGLRDE